VPGEYLENPDAALFLTLEIVGRDFLIAQNPKFDEYLYTIRVHETPGDYKFITLGYYFPATNDFSKACFINQFVIGDKSVELAMVGNRFTSSVDTISIGGHEAVIIRQGSRVESIEWLADGIYVTVSAERLTEAELIEFAESLVMTDTVYSKR